MSVSQSKFEVNRELLKKFIVNKPLDPKFDLLPYDKVFGCIYCIENITNGKKYIGATYSLWVGTAHEDPITQIKKRATNYLYEYNKAKSGTKSSSKSLRPIIKAMFEEGFDNFIMYPLAETTESNHNEAEKYFIDLYNTTYPLFGYNVVRGGANTKRPGTKLTALAKQVRSDPIICINLNNKQIIYSESMKLFADHMNTSKDMIKNANRSALSYKGWFVFYLNKEKRDYIFNAQYDPNFNSTRKHSKKALDFYKGLYNSVSQLLDNKNNEYFFNFEILPKLEYKD